MLLEHEQLISAIEVLRRVSRFDLLAGRSPGGVKVPQGAQERLSFTWQVPGRSPRFL
ncbi:MAG: hypothetical protein HC919_06885 [Oscillatoriales cyanobacterium SM2_2_1]|nr:hypothetical protein [Oscillatoriales cyanobacterium SM2_2_1]